MKMQLARIVGRAISTIKHPSLEGATLLLALPLQADGRSIDGDPILVVDTLDAGRAEKVIITSDGKGTRELLHSENTPARWAVLGIPD
ncbi:MAG: EutN/CcmL family microcompartment protein [Thermoguttaceae bacterium]